MSQRTPFLLQFAIFALAVNAVLIQTVVPEESSLKTLVRFGAIAAAGMYILSSNARVPIWLTLTVLASLSLLVIRGNPDQLSIAFALVLAAALCAAPEKGLLTTFVAASWVAIALIFALLYSGLTQNAVQMVDIGPLGEVRIRSSYGTASVPFFYNVVYGVATLTLLRAWKTLSRWRWMLTAVCLGGAWHFYTTTDLRGGFIAVVAFAVLLAVVPVAARWPFVRPIFAALPVLLLGLAFVTAAARYVPGLNVTLSGRPQLYDEFLGRLSWDDIVLSSSVKQFDRIVGDRLTIVDNSYLHLLVGGGILVFSAFSFVFGRAVTRLYRERRFPEIAFLVATLLYCSSESILLRIENVFIVYTWYLVVKYSRSPSIDEPAPEAPEADRVVSLERAAAAAPRL
ncbi:hypothetical protein KG112_11020 [Nocardioides sp. zg-ZUI104]|uniref:hypothetical protein n=1 Tax=Nocardioides faecalis TaxID=2803858 RepID=UPI001BCFC0B0|nr:hypothetical protein [Nocardioides faecalis]MBS4753333.1 hypothetical protein [Nocardioides faecalis]